MVPFHQFSGQFLYPFFPQGQNHPLSLPFDRISYFPSPSLYYWGDPHRSFFNGVSAVQGAVLSHPEWLRLMDPVERQIPPLEQMIQPVPSLHVTRVQILRAGESIPGSFDANPSEKNLREDPLRTKRSRPLDAFAEFVVSQSASDKVAKRVTPLQKKKRLVVPPVSSSPQRHPLRTGLRKRPDKPIQKELPDQLKPKGTFIDALFKELKDPPQNPIVKWSPDQQSLLVDETAFEQAEEKRLAPQWASLTRQFRYYGFYTERQGEVLEKIKRISHPILKREIPSGIAREEYLRDQLQEFFRIRGRSSRRHQVLVVCIKNS